MSNDAGSGDRNAQRLLQSTCGTTEVILTCAHLLEMHTMTGNAQQHSSVHRKDAQMRVSPVVKVAKFFKVLLTMHVFKVC